MIVSAGNPQKSGRQIISFSHTKLQAIFRTMDLIVEWAAQFSHSSNAEGIAQRSAFAGIQENNEQQAKKLFSDFKQHVVPDAIRLALVDDSHSIGIFLASWYLNTSAFREFSDWLTEQGLRSMCAQSVQGEREQPEQDVVLNIFPA